MGHLRFLMMFGLSLLLLLGCTSQQPAATNETLQQSSSNGSEQAQQNQTPSVSWEGYDNLGLSFDYPKGMAVQESLSSYYNGAGYATVILQDKASPDSPLILFVYTNLSSQDPQGEPQSIASGILSGDNKGTDPLGALHQASSKSVVSTFDTQNGYGAAQMSFRMEVADSSKEFSGYALELYDPVMKVGIAARIMSLNSTLSEDMKDRFVSTFRFGRPL